MNEVAVAVLGVLGLVGGGGGALTVYIQKRGDRPSGWQVAVRSLEKQVESLRADVESAREDVKKAEARADEVVAENHGLKETIAQQSKVITALGARNVQLMTAWPAGSRPPKPDPAHEPYL